MISENNRNKINKDIATYPSQNFESSRNECDVYSSSSETDKEEQQLNRILAELDDTRFTEDDNIETLFNTFTKNDLDLNIVDQICEKFNKHPQRINNSSNRCSIKILYEWLKHDNCRAWGKVKFTYFTPFEDLDFVNEYALTKVLFLFL